MVDLHKLLENKALLIGVIFAVLCFFAIVVFFVFVFSSFGFEKQVAVIPIKGEIFLESESSAFGPSVLGALEISDLIEQAENDSLIGVIFLDIDSPGGSVVASKQLVYKVLEAKKTKPIVSYIGETGASGAYYVASATDYIISDADSITGSIGVISIIPNIKELLGKIGVQVNVLTAGELKATGNIFEELTPVQRALIENLVLETFEEFKADVFSFRQEKLAKSEFEKIADGRILSGRQALSLKLVDELLSREKAIEKAARLAGIKGKPIVQNFQNRHSSIFDLFFLSGQAFGKGIINGFSLNSNNKPLIQT